MHFKLSLRLVHLVLDQRYLVEMPLDYLHSVVVWVRQIGREIVHNSHSSVHIAVHWCNKDATCLVLRSYHAHILHLLLVLIFAILFHLEDLIVDALLPSLHLGKL